MPRLKPSRRSIVGSVGNKLVLRGARVVEVERIAPRYVRLVLEGEVLRQRTFAPGEIIQIVSAGVRRRAYTPLSWDHERGRIVLVAYLHGDGPAARWAAAVAPGDGCVIAGPRFGVDLQACGRGTVLFGDETSLTTAAALRALDADAMLVLETDAVGDTRRALKKLGVDDAQLLKRRADGAHLDAAHDLMLEALVRDGSREAMLTGCAASIQVLYRALRRAGIRGSRITNRVYWAAGKRGLN